MDDSKPFLNEGNNSGSLDVYFQSCFSTCELLFKNPTTNYGLRRILICKDAESVRGLSDKWQVLVCEPLMNESFPSMMSAVNKIVSELDIKNFKIEEKV